MAKGFLLRAWVSRRVSSYAYGVSNDDVFLMIFHFILLSWLHLILRKAGNGDGAVVHPVQMAVLGVSGVGRLVPMVLLASRSIA